MKNWIQNILHILIHLIDSTANIAVLVFFIFSILFSVYSIWDTNHVYEKASPQVYEAYKPTQKDTRSFDELKKTNSEVIGWLTLYNTKIDYPYCQSKDNSKYVNTDIDGNFSLTGSLFLDYRNSSDLSNSFNIIYGHHMDKNYMFGGLDKFKNKKYFKQHQYGDIYIQNQHYGLKCILIANVDAYDEHVYNTSSNDVVSYMQYLQSFSIINESNAINNNSRILVLSTCTSDSTNGRTLLVAKITDKTYSLAKNSTSKKKTQTSSNLLIYILLLICIILFLIILRKKTYTNK